MGDTAGNVALHDGWQVDSNTPNEINRSLLCATSHDLGSDLFNVDRVELTMKRPQPTIRVRSRESLNSGLNVQMDREKRNTFSYPNNFPKLHSIILYGCALIVATVGLSYVVDPSAAREWSHVAASYLPFDYTRLGKAAKASIHHYKHWVTDALHDGNETSHLHVLIKDPLPGLASGYSTGLVTHSTKFDFIWQPPTERSERPGGGGIVFIAHACKRQPFEWFYKTEDCAVCDPMPIQVSITNQLRKNGFAVMAMAPVENPAKCWHQNDRVQVGLAMQYIVEATRGFYGNNSATSGSSVGSVLRPAMYAIGVENGGVFLGNYAESMGNTFRTKFSAMCLMNSGIWHKNMKAPAFPPVAFLDLARNGELCAHNNLSVQVLHAKNISAIQFYSEPRPITKDYFTPIMSVNESVSYHEELEKAGFLWPFNGVLLKDPTSDYYRRDMMAILSRVAPEVATSEAMGRGLNSPLMQLLRLAWGYREINDDHFDQIMEWFDLQGSKRSAASKEFLYT